MKAEEHYIALALQVACRTIRHLENREQAASHMQQTLGRLAGQIRASAAFIGPDTRLVVLPEYFLTGFPMGESIEQWATKACIEPGGPEYEALGRICQDNKLYLAGNAYELDEHFPSLYFQTSFIVAPGGDVILRYRRLISMFAPTPHDVLDRYLEIYGAQALFPVAETPIGRLAALASEEILYPEICRALALRGAEVICHPTSEVASPLPTPKHIARRARAFENMVYLVSANSAGLLDCAVPAASVDAYSAVVDFRGQVQAQADTGESMAVHAGVDLEALRRARSRPGMGNVLSRQRLDLFAATYAGTPVHPPNTLLAGAAPVVPDRKHFHEVQARVIRDLEKRGII